MKEPPIVAIYRDCTGLDTSCDTCKYSDRPWLDEPCGDCKGRHCGYEPIEGWEKENNMSRLIDGDALIKAISDFPYGYRGMIKNVIAEQPTVEERKKGKWNRRIVDSGYNADWVCSECKYTEKRDFPTKFCPNCGADMRGEQDG